MNAALAVLLVFTPTQAPVQLKTAHRMAERWGHTVSEGRHSMHCWQRDRAVRCRIVYHHIRMPVAPVGFGTWIDTVTVKRHRHRIVLTSDTMVGRLSQRG